MRQHPYSPTTGRSQVLTEEIATDKGIRSGIDPKQGEKGRRDIRVAGGNSPLAPQEISTRHLDEEGDLLAQVPPRCVVSCSHRDRDLSSPRKAGIVVTPDRDHGVVGKPLALQSGHESGQRCIEEMHGVEEVAKRSAIPDADIELLEMGRKAVEGMVQREGQKVGRERLCAGCQPARRLLQKVTIRETPADVLAPLKVLDKEALFVAIGGMSLATVPK